MVTCECGYKATPEEEKKYRWVMSFGNPYRCRKCLREKYAAQEGKKKG